MPRLAVLSMHTSPLAQAGSGDGGGMNVYVRRLSAALARAGAECDVFTRAWSPELDATVVVEPGLRVHHVPAGPLAPLPKEELPGVLGEFTEGVLGLLTGGKGPFTGEGADLLHANYWLSGVSGHAIKHALGVPLVSTFHTLARVKSAALPGEAAAEDAAGRELAERAVIGCSDAVLASCSVEAAQIAQLYGGDPSRIEVVAPGVEHAFFAPGRRPQARRAVGLPEDGAMLLFVGRIQPLKATHVAVRALASLDEFADAFLVVIGGPSGPHGGGEMRRLRELVASLGLTGRVFFVPPQPHELLSTYYRAANVCIVPSRSESFGLVALEAAACGVPVVASSVGGLRTLVDEGRTGFLVEEPDARLFAQRVAQVLSDEELAGKMGSAAATEAARYSWPEAARRVLDLCSSVTDRQMVECV